MYDDENDYDEHELALGFITMYSVFLFVMYFKQNERNKKRVLP